MKTTSNPLFSESRWASNPTLTVDSSRMTVKGAMNKTALLLIIVFAAGAWSWQKVVSGMANTGDISMMNGLLMGAALGGFIVALLALFKPESSPVLAPIYAVLEGVFLGAISAVFEAMYPGIILNAVLVTAGVFVAMLALYRTGVIRVTERFRTIIVAATLGIMLVYLLSIILGFFGIEMGFLHSGGPIGIAVSVFIAGIAALNLALDFDFIERGAKNGAPSYMEWQSALGLLITIVWLYVEILNLLSQLRD